MPRRPVQRELSAEELLTTILEAVDAIKRRVDDPMREDSVVRAIHAWLESNVARLRGEPGRDGEDGADGRSPTLAEIRAVVSEWLEENRESLRGAKGDRGPIGRTGVGLRGLKGDKGDPGRDGENASDSQVQVAVESWLKFHRETLRGPKGDKGDAAVGVERIFQSGHYIVVQLTDGTKHKFVLPGVGGSGGGGGQARREVYIDELPVITFPAISFKSGEFAGLPNVFRLLVHR